MSTWTLHLGTRINGNWSRCDSFFFGQKVAWQWNEWGTKKEGDEYGKEIKKKKTFCPTFPLLSLFRYWISITFLRKIFNAGGNHVFLLFICVHSSFLFPFYFMLVKKIKEKTKRK